MLSVLDFTQRSLHVMRSGFRHGASCHHKARVSRGRLRLAQRLQGIQGLRRHKLQRK